MTFWWLIDSHFFVMASTASRSAPASWLVLTGLFVDLGALPADCGGGPAVTVVGRDAFAAATHLQTSALLATSRPGKSEQYLAVQNKGSD
jgi:hypothetical protein